MKGKGAGRSAPRLRRAVDPDGAKPTAFRIGNDLAPVVVQWTLRSWPNLRASPRPMIRNATRGPRTAPPVPTEATHTPSRRSRAKPLCGPLLRAL
jgi:hypothetical protein